MNEIDGPLWNAKAWRDGGGWPGFLVCLAVALGPTVLCLGIVWWFG